MFRHCVMMKFRDDATAEQRQAAVDAIAELQAKIPEIVAYSVGLDAGVREDNFHLAAVIDFASKADYEVYATHPDHVEAIQQHLAPIMEARSAVQYECSDHVEPASTHRIEVNIDDCMSSGKCVADYPHAFDFDDDELAVLQHPETLSDGDMIRAARNCPSRALTVFDADGNQVPT